MPEMKTSWLKIAFIGVVSVLNLTAVRMSVAQGSSRCDAAALPAPISELLKSKFAQWRPKQVSDMEADDQQFWLKGPNATGCPGIAIGHFESADSLSYALLLVPQSDPSGGHKIVVFSKDATKDVYTSRLLDHAETQTYSGLVISKAEPGKYKDWEAKKSIQIKLDGLYVEWMGKGAQLYYWRAGRYEKLQVSD
jgi:hypothetical protein